MTRRGALLAVFESNRPKPAVALPANPQTLNSFKEAWNRYVAVLKEGVNDPRLWKRVVDAWLRIS